MSESSKQQLLSDYTAVFRKMHDQLMLFSQLAEKRVQLERAILAPPPKKRPRHRARQPKGSTLEYVKPRGTVSVSDLAKHQKVPFRRAYLSLWRLQKAGMGTLEKGIFTPTKPRKQLRLVRRAASHK